MYRGFKNNRRFYKGCIGNKAKGMKGVTGVIWDPKQVLVHYLGQLMPIRL